MAQGPAVNNLFGDVPQSGAFADSKIPPTAIERVIAEIIWPHQGRQNPIAIATLSKIAGKSERDIKGIVEQLVVTHRMRIGGRREEPAGYFVIVDAEDLAVAIGAYQKQIFAMWRRLRVLLSKRELAELHGQLVIEEREV